MTWDEFTPEKGSETRPCRSFASSLSRSQNFSSITLSWVASSRPGTRTAITWPADLGEELRPLIVDPSSPPLDELRAILPMSDLQAEEMIANLSEEARRSAESTLKSLAHGLGYDRIIVSSGQDLSAA